MRVIAGKAKSLRLKTIEGMGTRPTTDRIKETLFNMIQSHMADCRFLDLFAGSGGIGIEALSRGAAFCVFVEQDRKAAACIRENLTHTHLEQQASLLVMDALAAIRKLDGEAPFDCIFMDPPYRMGLEFQVLEALKATSLIDQNTLIMIEEALDEDMSQERMPGYMIIKDKRYKTNRHVFVQKGDQK